MFNLIMQTTAGTGQSPNAVAGLLPFILIGLVFYFLLIRPQNKRMKEHRAMLDAVTRGDTIVTNGGLIGKVTKVADDTLTVDLGNNVSVKVVASMLADVRGKNAAPETDTKSDKASSKKSNKK